MMTPRITVLLRAIFIVLLLTTQSYPRPVHRPEDRLERDVPEVQETKNDAKPQYKNVPKDDGKPDKEGPKEEPKKEEDGHDVDVVFQGDIIISYEELLELKVKREDARGLLDRSRRNTGSGASPIEAYSEKVYNKLWPDCKVPFLFEPLLDSRLRESFGHAMMMWEKNTCIRFKPRKQSDKDYLVLRKGEICKSHVGKQGGMQDVFIADRCNTSGHAAHELGHAIGLWHEHSRPDRDDFIRFHDENVYDKRDRVNFQIITTDQFKEMPFVSYDIQSIMHYSSYAFTLNYEPGKETITVRKDANLPELNCTNTLPMGQRKELSYLDKKRLSLLYDCEFNLEAPECLLPTPSATTPPETTEPVTTTMPTPTTTTEASITFPPVSNKLNTGNVVVLKFGVDKIGDEEVFGGIECVPSPGCTPTQRACVNEGGDSCILPESQFQIINHQSISKSEIKSGNTVLLRSFNKPAYWLDCSDIRRCKISMCREDYVEDPANSSYTSNCSKHHFQLLGVRNNGKRLKEGTKLKTKHKLQLKYGEHGFMNCNNHICHVLEEGSCPQRPLRYSAPILDTTCAPQPFNVTKILE